MSSRQVSLTEAVPTSLVLLNWLWPTHYQYVSRHWLLPWKLTAGTWKSPPKNKRKPINLNHPPPLWGVQNVSFLGVYPPGKLTYPPIKTARLSEFPSWNPFGGTMSTGGSWGGVLYMLVFNPPKPSPKNQQETKHISPKNNGFQVPNLLYFQGFMFRCFSCFVSGKVIGDTASLKTCNSSPRRFHWMYEAGGPNTPPRSQPNHAWNFRIGVVWYLENQQFSKPTDLEQKDGWWSGICKSKRILDFWWILMDL